jgi:hypothetical protein
MGNKAIQIGREWFPVTITKGKIRFTEGADQCDDCGYPLDGMDIGPNKIVLVDFGKIQYVKCQCGK